MELIALLLEVTRLVYLVLVTYCSRLVEIKASKKK
nr:MAG TPA: hypothetical protein [Caudoviricetes sp.]